MSGRRIAIIGAGNMGAWLASTFCGKHEIALFDIDEGKARAARGVKVLSKLEELEQFKPEMLINAVSLQNTIAAFEEALAYLPESCVLVDVASVKGDLPKFYGKCARRFASVHPMFGPTFANMDSLKTENAVIIRESDPDTASFFREFFSGFGIQVYDYSFAEHDKTMAYSLTTPFVSSLVFASCVEKTAVPGTTFARHMGIAKGLLSEDEQLLCEILFNKYSLPQLERITSRLEYLKHIIKGRDYDEARKLLHSLKKNLG